MSYLCVVETHVDFGPGSGFFVKSIDLPFLPRVGLRMSGLLARDSEEIAEVDELFWDVEARIWMLSIQYFDARGKFPSIEEACAALLGNGWSRVQDDSNEEPAPPPTTKVDRIFAAHIVSLIYDGWTRSDILRVYRGLTEDDIRAALESEAANEKPAPPPP